MINQADFIFFDKSLKFTNEVSSPSLFHNLLIPSEDIWLIDAFGSEITSIPKGCSGLVYPLLNYKISVNVSKPMQIQLLAINNRVFDSFLFSTDFFSRINQVIKRNDVSLLSIDEETTQSLLPIYNKISNEFQFEWMVATLEILQLIADSPTQDIHAVTNNEKHLTFYNQVNEYIGENISHAIDIKTISNYFCLSESTFSHRFREIFETSFHHYFIVKKIEKSCEMLKYTNENIQEIGYALGFNSTSHFISSFRQVKQTTPGKYRAKKLRLSTQML